MGVSSGHVPDEQSPFWGYNGTHSVRVMGWEELGYRYGS